LPSSHSSTLVSGLMRMTFFLQELQLPTRTPSAKDESMLTWQQGDNSFSGMATSIL